MTEEEKDFTVIDFWESNYLKKPVFLLKGLLNGYVFVWLFYKNFYQYVYFFQIKEKLITFNILNKI